MGSFFDCIVRDITSLVKRQSVFYLVFYKILMKRPAPIQPGAQASFWIRSLGNVNTTFQQTLTNKIKERIFAKIRSIN